MESYDYYKKLRETQPIPKPYDKDEQIRFIFSPIEYMDRLIEYGCEEKVAYDGTCALIKTLAQSTYDIQYELLMNDLKEGLKSKKNEQKPKKI